jgi:hypothetical protein
MKKRLTIGALLAAVGVILIQIPDIRRYMRIRSM